MNQFGFKIIKFRTYSVFGLCIITGQNNNLRKSSYVRPKRVKAWLWFDEHSVIFVKQGIEYISRDQLMQQDVRIQYYIPQSVHRNVVDCYSIFHSVMRCHSILTLSWRWRSVSFVNNSVLLCIPLSSNFRSSKKKPHSDARCVVLWGLSYVN
jgi:hypothetical protein